MSVEQDLGRLIERGAHGSAGEAWAKLSNDAQLAMASTADRHLVVPTLAGICRSIAPASINPDVRHLLQFVYTANDERNTRLQQQVLEVGRQLEPLGIELVLLKGAIRLFDGLYPAPAWRFMSDIDLLLPETQARLAWSHLQEHGYIANEQPSAEDRFETHHHLPPLHHTEREGALEIHTSLGRDETRGLLPANEVIKQATRTKIDGVFLRFPTLKHQLVHAISHTFLQHRRHLLAPVQLRDLLEFYLLIRAQDFAIDSVRDAFASYGKEWPVDASIQLLNDYFGVELEVSTTLTSRMTAGLAKLDLAHPLLRSLRFRAMNYIVFGLPKAKMPYFLRSRFSTGI